MREQGRAPLHQNDQSTLNTAENSIMPLGHLLNNGITAKALLVIKVEVVVELETD